MSHFNNVNVGVTGFVFDSRYTFTGLGYLAICWQKQWGYLQKQAEKWIYPIPVLEAFIATKTCISNNHSAAGYVGYWTWDKDITTEYAYSWNNYPSYCFMIGKVQQQWGFISNNKAVFPIAFTAFCSAATLFIRGSGTGTWYGDNANVTLTGLSCITPDYVLNGNFIAIGV